MTERDSASPLQVYESHPPEWLPKTHKTGELGYPGFHPPRPGQDEDLLTESNIKNGFTFAAPVAAETFSAQAVVDLSEDVLGKLEDLMNEVFTRRADRVPAIPPASFRIPSRVTLNDARRTAWFTDLANPDVPLYKLGKSVPHGAKGHDLLDLLQSNNVDIPRAVFLLRVFGANETAGLRNRPSYNPMQYSIDWANIVTSYLKKQLSDIALPSAPRPGMNIKQMFKGVLSESDTRERWVSRFSYCLQLLRPFYTEGLVDHRTFLTWLVQQMSTCNLAQAGFVTRLTEEYLDGMVLIRALAHPLAEACLCKLSEIRSSSTPPVLSNTEASLKSILQRVCLTTPDVYISPRMWLTYQSLLQDVFADNPLEHFSDQHVERSAQGLHQLLFHNFSDIKRRNEAMLFCKLPPRALARLGSAATDVQLLNSISSSITDLSTFQFFNLEAPPDPDFAEKLDLLLTWSVTPLQFGEHRPLAAVTLIKYWRDRCLERAARRRCTPPDEFLQDQLFEWLDRSDVAADPANARAVALIFGKLVKHQLFSYAVYMQRLIARGENGMLMSDETPSRHRNFLRLIPIYNSTSSLTGQRKVILYGARARETPEDANERAIRKEIRALLPELFVSGSQPPPSDISELLQCCPTLMSASRFEQVRTLKQWLLPILKTAITSAAADSGAHPHMLKSYCLAVELMTHAQCFSSILDLTLIALEQPPTLEFLNAVMDTLQRFRLLWICMDSMPRITTALYAAHLGWKARGTQSRNLLTLLCNFDGGRHLDPISREHVEADICSLTLTLQPETGPPEPMPDVLPEILMMAGDPAPDAPSVLANSLWFKYRSAPNWAWKVWDNAIASLRQVPSMTSEAHERQLCALRYGDFLLHVDQHLPNGLDDQVLSWFLGPGRNEVAALSNDAWTAVRTVLLFLSINGALRTTTILEGLIYPVWHLAAYSSADDQAQSLSSFLASGFDLFELLLLREVAGADQGPPSDILEIQAIRTRRQDVCREPDFSRLVSHIPVLVCLENNPHVPAELKSRCTALRLELCEARHFRKGVYRNLDAVRDSFEQFVVPGHVGRDLGEQIVLALRKVLCEDCDHNDSSLWPDISKLLSPWKLAATAIELKFILRQVGRTTFQSQTRQAANVLLDKLTNMLFRHSMTSEEAYFVAEMAKGVDADVAAKFINNGLNCLVDILKNSGISREDRTHRVGELLRVLAYIAEPFRGDNALPQADANIQDNLIDALRLSFSALKSSLRVTEEEDHDSLAALTEWAVLLARLLQFVLGFQGSQLGKIKAHGAEIGTTLFKIALFYGSRQALEVVAYSLIVDTLFYLLDEIPLDTKSLTFDPLKSYPDLPASELPQEMPQEYRTQLLSLLPHFPPNHSVAHLATAHRDASGALVLDGPVLNRPWEWIENLGEPPGTDTDDSSRLGFGHIVKNTGSLPLELFGARMTGDAILHVDDPRLEAVLRTFEDGLAVDDVRARDWRETRVELDGEAVEGSVGARAKADGEHDAAGSSSARSVGRSTPRMSSPASSALSRLSAQAGSIRQSPGQVGVHRLSTPTGSDVMSVDSVKTTSSGKRLPSKRKASAVSDDEIEIIEGPIPGRAPPKPKRGKTAGKTAGKSKSKR
ncbi:hypothetical protein HGRIS_002336 [Hohenbuehelia grisea]|uniref:Mediator of RNA polymerase II transcription subunit 12 n=1 Tax=Hohenbuehelia grisea TaxID=104357 RepID=A0ABR3JKB4_9AGAR